VTISISGTPARFRSTWLTPGPVIASSWIDFPASSSMWMRVSGTERGSPPTSIGTAPPVA
jgi:hypothetical protein